MDITLLIITVLSIIGIIVQIMTRKQEERQKSNFIIGIQYSVMILIVVLSTYSQYNSSNQETKYKKAVLELDVLSKLNNGYLTTFENMMIIGQNYEAIFQYKQLKNVEKELGDDFNSLLSKFKLSEKTEVKLEKIRTSLDKIKKYANLITMLNINHPNIIPKEALEWSEITSKINLDNIDIYFNPYAEKDKTPNKSVMEYHEKFGKMSGLIIGKIRKASSYINSL